MSAEQLAAWVRSRPQLAAGGAGLVVLVALVGLRKTRKASPAAAASDPAAIAAQTAGLSGTPNTAAVDSANSFSDALTAISQQISQLGGGGSAAPAGPAPAADSRKFVRFFDAANPKAIYLIENGHAEWLSPAQWAEFVRQGAKVTGASVLDNLWSVVAPVQAPANGRRPLPPPVLHQPAHTPMWPQPHQPLPRSAPPPTGVRPQTASYTLRPGESLHDAAAAVYGPDRAGAMASAIAAHNGVRTTVTRGGQNIAHTYAGQTLRLP